METKNFIKKLFKKTWLKSDDGFKLNKEVNSEWYINIYITHDHLWSYNIGKRHQKETNNEYFGCLSQWKNVKDAKDESLKALQIQILKK